MEDQKLFEVDGGDVPAGVTATVTVTPHRWPRCTPIGIRIPLEVAEAFKLRGIYCGVEAVLPTTPVGDDPPRTLKAVVLERGMDFSVQIENISDAAQHFACEVWGTADKDAECDWCTGTKRMASNSPGEPCRFCCLIEWIVWFDGMEQWPEDRIPPAAPTDEERACAREQLAPSPYR